MVILTYIMSCRSHHPNSLQNNIQSKIFTKTPWKTHYWEFKVGFQVLGKSSNDRTTSGSSCKLNWMSMRPREISLLKASKAVVYQTSQSPLRKAGELQQINKSITFEKSSGITTNWWENNMTFLAKDYTGFWEYILTVETILKNMRCCKLQHQSTVRQL